MSGFLIGPCGVAPATGGAVIPLSLDGSAHATSPTASSQLVNLTTTNANDVIILFVESNAGPITTVSSSPSLTWHFRATANSAGAGFPIEEWWAFAPSANTYGITVTQTGTDFIAVDAFGVTGSKTSGSPFDTNVSLPATSGTAPVSVSTTALNTFIVGGFRDSNPANPTAGGSFNQISGADFMLSEYLIVSAAQSGLSVTMTTGFGACNGAIGDALVQGP